MGKIKILIVEHDLNDIELLLFELGKSGIDHETKVVQNEINFRKALDKFQPDIILSDYSLPSFDGYTAFKIKQIISPGTPFIFVSGTIGEESAVELIKNGVTDYALKDKIYTLNLKIIRALKDKNAADSKLIADEKLKNQNNKLFEIAFLQSHQVRAPVAHILGLISLFKSDNLTDPINKEIIKMLQTTTLELDKIIYEISERTNEIKDMK
ncbi:MAG: DNA-binding transcriptional regulator BaeR [Bacteroidetes bacterium]|jgi:DNA-binding NtrC family response regulator|nr:DNA-binding transcriptional regulator BaeR [Bacteroidota bacterium]